MEEPPRKRLRSEVSQIVCLSQAITGDELCRANREDLLQELSRVLSVCPGLLYLASSLLDLCGTKQWSWSQFETEQGDLPSKMTLIRHAGRWNFLSKVVICASEATNLQDLLLPPLLTPDLPGSVQCGLESRKSFQSQVQLIETRVSPLFQDSQEISETEWSNTCCDAAALLLLLETRGRDFFLFCQKDQATFKFQQIVGIPERSYFILLLRRASELGGKHVPEALPALEIACSKEIEVGCSSKGFRWDHNPAVVQCLAMRSEIGALALRLYFDLHDVCPRVVHESFPEAKSLLRVVLNSDQVYHKHLLKPVLKRLAFSRGISAARLLTSLFIDSLDGESTEKDFCKWIERFWHFDVKQLLQSVGQPVLTRPPRLLQASWSSTSKTTHELLERDYKQHPHEQVLSWAEFAAKALNA